MKFKVGDRVAVYGTCNNEVGEKIIADRAAAVIVEIPIDTCLINVKTETETLWVHPKQCRRLIKKKRREIWLGNSAYEDAHKGVVCSYVTFSLTPKEGYTKFREVK